ncbi:MAG: family 16 glycoside hydrolase [Verrucomicrobiia bacterium]
MRRAASWLLTLCFVCPCLADERIIDFSKFPAGQAPPGFRSVLSGRGKPGDWQVIADPAGSPSAAGSTNPVPAGTQVLAQLSQDATDERFPMLILEGETFGDFKFTTRFKLVDGLFEQMAGIAFRIQDTNNYYYIRASALGNTFRFIKLVDGQRLTTLGPSVEIAKGVWHDLQIECKGNQISCLLNGKALIPTLTDNTFMAGKIGFWTMSDSVSYFGETRITFTRHESLAQALVNSAMKQYPRLLGIRMYALRGEGSTPKVVASNHQDEIGMEGGGIERDVIERDVMYYGKDKGVALVTMPLHDRNGEVAAALRLVMQSFLGQTEQNAIARAKPVVQHIESRIRTLKDLLE